jgi:hypothetical protein
VRDLQPETNKVTLRELFIQDAPLEVYDWVCALTRMISAVFRQSDDLMFVAKELQEVFSVQGGYYKEGTYYTSLMAEIGVILQQHLTELETINASDACLKNRIA